VYEISPINLVEEGTIVKPVEDVDSMQAGRELDEVIALDVMGWEHRTESWYDGEGVEGSRFIGPNGEERTAFGHYNYDLEELDLPRYSTDIAAAWEVVERMNNKGWFSDLSIRQSDSIGERYMCAFASSAQYEPWNPASMAGYTWAGTMPLAICKAALRAVYEFRPFNQD
jgi:hypothetical protein